MDMRRLVGGNVRRIRQKKGLTQEQLANISGFSQRYISGLERGHRNPTVVTVYELATALGASYLDLMRPPPRGKRKLGPIPARGSDYSQFPSLSRCIAGLSGFFVLSQLLDGPDRYPWPAAERVTSATCIRDVIEDNGSRWRYMRPVH